MPWADTPAILLADEGDLHDLKEVSMYHYNDFEAWRDHRDELLQEAEQRRLARQLRAARSGEKALQIRRSLPRLVAGLLPQGRKMAGC
jgi:phosphoserine phosphatase